MPLSDLRLAVSRNQLRLTFVPLADHRAGAVAGFVVHVCWERPGHGAMAPKVLRPLADRLGVTRELDQYSIERTGEVLAGWGPDVLESLQLAAVVVDPETLADPAAHRVARAVSDLAGLPPGRLRLVSGWAVLNETLRASHLRTTTGPVPAATARRLLERTRAWERLRRPTPVAGRPRLDRLLRSAA